MAISRERRLNSKAVMGISAAKINDLVSRKAQHSYEGSMNQ
ncbi:hypothetical protein EV13_1847 [Prochlorococcus sp. MIT 0702]|nr:hypothetical protein EV12_1416 [Prochlorococcus sp. MIT 0701]KGG27954.1 hypothetical protein EV13_1847 [Prochlorococcus sp. MIT 0702]KGG31323.1 hypothetical protein EV14_2274 [Prochlorococcus sp. MIT 0703]